MMRIKTLCSLTAALVSVAAADLMAANSKPNMVLFLADDLTYRDIGCYGSPDAITPRIDQLAEEGMLFTKCYQAATMCSPTRHNLYNGLYPVRSGAHPNHTFAEPWVKSMPHYLKDLGYRVGFIGKGHIGPREVYPFEYLGDKKKGTDHIDMGLSERFLKEVAGSDQPFCLVICSHQPHGPLTLGDPSMWDADEITLRGNQVDTPVFRERFVRYLAEINFLDGQVDTVLNQLEDNSLSDNTLFLFLGEQGNSFALSKWSLYEDGVKSAMIARWPGVIEPGQTTDALVEYNDIVPTFIAMAGGEIPEILDGVSILPIFKNPELPGKQYAFSTQTTRGIIKGSDYYGIRSVTDGKYRYIYNLSPEAEFSNGDTVVRNKNHWWGSWWDKAKKEKDPHATLIVNKVLSRPQEELYDVEADPDNLVNLADREELSEVKARMKKALGEWMVYCGDEGLKTELLAFQRMRSNRNPEDPEIRAYMEPLRVSDLNEASYGQDESFEGYIEIPMDGYYTFYKDKKKRGQTVITVNDIVVVDQDPRIYYGIIGLKAGVHRITVAADTKKGTGQLRWSGPKQLPKPLTEAPLFQ